MLIISHQIVVDWMQVRLEQDMYKSVWSSCMRKNKWSLVSSAALHRTHDLLLSVFQFATRSHVESLSWVASHISIHYFGVECWNHTIFEPLTPLFVGDSTYLLSDILHTIFCCTLFVNLSTCSRNPLSTTKKITNDKCGTYCFFFVYFSRTDQQT